MGMEEERSTGKNLWLQEDYKRKIGTKKINGGIVYKTTWNFVLITLFMYRDKLKCINTVYNDKAVHIKYLYILIYITQIILLLLFSLFLLVVIVSWLSSDAGLESKLNCQHKEGVIILLECNPLANFFYYMTCSQPFLHH